MHPTGAKGATWRASGVVSYGERKGWTPLQEATSKPSNFIREIVAEDVRTGAFHRRIHTRFPPEPNGYLHIGHAKAITIDFGIAAEFGGLCNLRFDDTNPIKEDTEYVDSIMEDVRWLGFDWDDRLYYASDYFEQLYQYAVRLIQLGKAYVCDLSPDEVREYRGTLTEPGRESPYRNRSVEENLDLFQRMRAGEFPDGARTLRAKIDMAAGNINLRDPVLYRIQHATHHRTGDRWCIYPTYDFAHPLSDAIEGITHSLCSLEFEDHRPLYNWLLETLGFVEPPKQIEFARLELTYTLTSKRKLRQLVEEGYVRGWDDPRMPTLKGLRRRGYTPAAIRELCERIGVNKTKGVVDIEYLEHLVREDLNRHAPRVMAVLRPLKVVLTNYPEGQEESFPVENNPEDPQAGTRLVPFSREIYVEREDFAENPPARFFRLAPGREVRLKGAYIIRCDEVVKDPATGEVTELRCTCDLQSRGGEAPDGRRVPGTLHWVSIRHAWPAEVRLYDRLFATEDPEAGGDFLANLNPNSLEVLTGCWVEPSLRTAKALDHFQFLRHGYFCVDPDSTPERLVFNRTVALRDTWAKIQRKSVAG
ncbi:MAG: glutamine--tRNA ligase/YqeY domain fusion protein [Limnochordaceae bacterium]|nr:glutamine--tRNA ligase/YqeY domain fusion protein [Limnochordaceae bacterium]